jgi:hypothetical protein
MVCPPLHLRGVSKRFSERLHGHDSPLAIRLRPGATRSARSGGRRELSVSQRTTASDLADFSHSIAALSSRTFPHTSACDGAVTGGRATASRRNGRASTRPALRVTLERIWNGEAEKGEQAERLRRAVPGLTKPDLGRTGTHETRRADFASRRSRKSGFSSFCGWTHGVHTVSGQVFRALVNRVEGLSPGLLRLSS